MAQLAPFRPVFSTPVWRSVLVLVAGTLLASGRRTVCAALRVTGLAQTPHFVTFHRVLNRACWCPRALARLLLTRIVAAFVPSGPVVIGLDDTIEPRRGPQIAARGVYRDPVRSSRRYVVKVGGLRWLCLMVLVPIPWARRHWALPFLTVLASSERYHAERQRRHQRLADWARQALLQTRRWLPGRQLVAVADSSFAALDLIAAVAPHLCLISRLRLDANLCDPPPPRRPGQRGRPPVKGNKRHKLSAELTDPAARWRRVTVTGWYGLAQTRCLDILSDTAVWYSSGLPVVPLRWVLVRDPKGVFEPQAFLCTDTAADPVQILLWFVLRWQMEVTFEESRAHLGIETQRQWTDPAIARTTPVLFGVFAFHTVGRHTADAIYTVAARALV